MTTISFATTAYQETVKEGHGAWLLQCLQAPLADPRITEIVVTDDGSADWEPLQDLLKGYPKVKLFHLPVNRGPFGAKLATIANCTGDWVLNIDSDNWVDQKYLDLVFSHMPGIYNWVYCPTQALPAFDYRAFAGKEIDLQGFVDLTGVKAFDCFMNTYNQLIPRKPYLQAMDKYLNVDRWDLLQPAYFGEAWRHDLKHRRVFDSYDSLFMNLLWLKSDPKRRLFGLSGMEHQHRLHGDSTYNRGGAEKEYLSAIFFLEVFYRLRQQCFDYRAVKRGPKGEFFIECHPVGATSDPCQLVVLECNNYKNMKLRQITKGSMGYA